MTTMKKPGKTGSTKYGSQTRAKVAARRLETVTSAHRAVRTTKQPRMYDAQVNMKSFGILDAIPGLFKSPPVDMTNASHKYGFIPIGLDGNMFSIINANKIKPKVDVYIDGSAEPVKTDVIMGPAIQKIKVTLDKLYIGNYPGGNVKHRILFEFSGKNQVKNQANSEEVRFAQTYTAFSGGDISVTGKSIFIDLNVSEAGVDFGCRTVNVQNVADHEVLDLLNSQTIKNGLKIAETVQPALAPLVSITQGLTEMFLKRNDNKLVQEFSMGLDFKGSVTSPRLALGSYVVVQVPNSEGDQWDWGNWVYDRDRELIVRKQNNAPEPAPKLMYNYLIFGVS